MYIRVFFWTSIGTTHSHTHGSLPDLVKNTGPTHRSHSHSNHSSHACHKQANVEHIKRVSCNDCQYSLNYF